MTSTNKRVIALWGAHRKSPSKKSDPSSIDKGVPELRTLGFDILSIYPSKFVSLFPNAILGKKKDATAYRVAIVALLLRIRSADLLYTTDNTWARWIARLKKIGIIRNRFVFKWAGFDLPWDDMLNGTAQRQVNFFGEILRQADTIFVISPKEISYILRVFPFAKGKVCFWPTGIDVSYYAQYSKPMSSSGLVAVGSDNKRDWDLVVGLARRGVEVTIVTEDPNVKRMVDELGNDLPTTLNLAYRVGLDRSAEIMGRARALIISTFPNNRLSGATTIGTAAALGKPLILDVDDEITRYGLEPGHNCEVFEAGNIDSALEAIERIYSDPVHEEATAFNIRKIADALDIKYYADALAAGFTKTDRKVVFSHQVTPPLVLE